MLILLGINADVGGYRLSFLVYRMIVSLRTRSLIDAMRSAIHAARVVLSSGAPDRSVGAASFGVARLSLA